MNGCRVGRVLRRLEDGEVCRKGDIFFYRDCTWDHIILSIGIPWSISDRAFRPLTPEEVEDYKRRIE